MKKFVLMSVVFILVAMSGVFILRPSLLLPHKDPLYIGVAGPLREPDGQAMLRGIQLYLDRLNRQGGIHQRPITLLPFDDHNDSRSASHVAQEIVSGNKVLLVLGHYGSDASLAAGDMYRENGIPAITASAAADSVTFQNEWYFSVVPDNTFQATFSAHYLKHILKQTAVSVVASADYYGASFAAGFLKAAPKLGIDIRQKWEFDRESDYLERRLSRISTELRTARDPGAIVFATHAPEAVRILSSIQLPGTNYTILGPDSFATQFFLEELRKLPQERAQPGYYSNGIYATAPFMTELAGSRAQTFRKAFRHTYQQEPSWVAAGYYDAMHVAAEAIKRAEIQTHDDVWTRRRKIRETLTDLNHRDIAVEGITGLLYFNQEGKIEKPFAVGKYQQQHFLPAFSQYRLLSPEEIRQNASKGASERSAISIAGYPMAPFQIVYAGIDINHISGFQRAHSRYTADLYLWFRFQHEFDDRQITFMNALTPLTLPSPFLIEQNADSTTHVYQIKGEFASQFDFRAYPFDRQTLPIRLRHTTQPADVLLYTPDIVGMAPTALNTSDRTAIFPATSGWTVENMLYAQVPVSLPSKTSEQEQQFSLFAAEIQIRRQRVSMLVKPFVPVLVGLLLLWWMYFLPAERHGMQGLFVLTSLVITALGHQQVVTQFSSEDPLSIHYAFLIVYGLALLSGLFPLFPAFRLFLRLPKNEQPRPRARFAGRIIYPVLVVGLSLVYLLHVNGLSEGEQMPMNAATGIQQQASATVTAQSQLAELTAVVYRDTDENGEYQPEEEGIETVELRLDTGHVLTTENNGQAQFQQLAPCAYRLSLNESTLPEHVFLTTDASQSVTLTPGDRQTVYFGASHQPWKATPTPTPTPTPSPTPTPTPTPDLATLPTPTPTPEIIETCTFQINPQYALWQIAERFTESAEHVLQTIMRYNGLTEGQRSLWRWQLEYVKIPKYLLLERYKECHEQNDKD